MCFADIVIFSIKEIPNNITNLANIGHICRFCGESDESDPRESGVKVVPLKSHEKTRFKRHFHRQSTRTMRLKTNTIIQR